MKEEYINESNIGYIDVGGNHFIRRAQLYTNTLS